MVKFKEGDVVEVLRKDTSPCGSWWKAEVALKCGNSYFVRYEELLDIDMNRVVEPVSNRKIRPVPLTLSSEGIGDFAVGDVVEVIDCYCWRVGQIKKQLSTDKFLVAMIGSGVTAEFQRRHIRMRLMWSRGRWNVIGKVGRIKTHPMKKSMTDGKLSRRRGPKSKKNVKHVVCEGNVALDVMRPVRHDKSNQGPLEQHLGVIGATCVRRGNVVGKRKHLIGSTRRSLKKVDAVTFSETPMTENCMHTLQRESFGSDVMGVSRNRFDDYDLHFFERPSNGAEDRTTSSVGSCSTSYPSSFPVQKSKDPIRKSVSKNEVDDAESICDIPYFRNGIGSSSDSVQEAIHELELHAYRSTLLAFHASGSLNWEREKLLTDLRLTLHISCDEHLFEVHPSGSCYPDCCYGARCQLVALDG